jgi:hypothetical protein
MLTSFLGPSYTAAAEVRVDESPRMRENEWFLQHEAKLLEDARKAREKRESGAIGRPPRSGASSRSSTT